MSYSSKLTTLVFLTILSTTATIHAGEIHDAIRKGDLDQVKVLLEMDTTLLESKDNRGLTPLHTACEFGKIEIGNLLIDMGADVNALDNASYTPLIRACLFQDNQDVTLIQRLINEGTDVNRMVGNGITPLHYAALRGGLKVAKLLIDNGADVNAYDKYNGPVETNTVSGTVLQIAIENYPMEELATFLVENGAKFNRRDPNGNTELHLAAFKGYADLTQRLIDHGADINAQNNNNRTAIYYAARYGYKSVANILIAAGADQNAIVETNYGKASQLTEKLKKGEAYLWYHSFLGYAVKTKSQLIIFRPNAIDTSLEAGLANGHINPNELADQKITIFNVYPSPGWKPMEKLVSDLVKYLPEANWVIEPNQFGSNEDNLNIPSYHLAAPNENFSVGDVQIHSIPALSRGMGYLVEADGVKIFYGGLHISSNKASDIEKYREEIDFLKPFGPIDIAILTVESHSRLDAAYEPYLYMIDELAPKAIYLMGANVSETFPKCAKILQVRNIPVAYPESRKGWGERFHYMRD